MKLKQAFRASFYGGTAMLGVAALSGAQIQDEARISNLSGGFSGVAAGDAFGSAVVSLGDLAGTGEMHLAVSAPFTGPAGTSTGSAFVLRLDASAQVVGEVEIGNGLGGFGGTIDSGDAFGSSLASLGDIDGDGVEDLAVGAPSNGDLLTASGAVWILRLNADGTVKGTQKVSLLAGNAPATLPIGGFFGTGLAGVGDLDNDGVPDLAATQLGGNATAPAGVWILFLNSDGTVKSSTRFGAGDADFPGALNSRFGDSLAFLGDAAGTGNPVLAIGDAKNGTAGEGGVWLTQLLPDGSNTSVVVFSQGLGGFPGNLAPGDNFGSALAPFDVNEDGSLDLVVGANFDSRAAAQAGSIWLLELSFPTPVADALVVAEGLGGFEGTLSAFDHFGGALCAPGDLNGDGRDDLLVGAPRADEGDTNVGALWVLDMGCSSFASVTSRNGSGLNSSIMVSLTSPILGSNWDVDIDTAGHAPAFAAVVLYEDSFEGFFLAGGELLVDVTSPFGASVVQPHTGNVVLFSIPIPDDVSLCAYTGSAQGIVFGPPQYKLSNALDVIVGY